MNEDYEKDTYTAGYTDIETCYSMPFTAKKADELYKLCTDKTAFMISLGSNPTGFPVVKR